MLAALRWCLVNGHRANPLCGWLEEDALALVKALVVARTEHEGTRRSRPVAQDSAIEVAGIASIGNRSGFQTLSGHGVQNQRDRCRISLAIGATANQVLAGPSIPPSGTPVHRSNSAILARARPQKIAHER